MWTLRCCTVRRFSKPFTVTWCLSDCPPGRSLPVLFPEHLSCQIFFVKPPKWRVLLRKGVLLFSGTCWSTGFYCHLLLSPRLGLYFSDETLFIPVFATVWGEEAGVHLSTIPKLSATGESSLVFWGNSKAFCLYDLNSYWFLRTISEALHINGTVHFFKMYPHMALVLHRSWWLCQHSNCSDHILYIIS